MTTTVRITNEGPERAAVLYYDEKRVLKRHGDVLGVGTSIVINVWDGCIPVVTAVHLADQAILNPSFYSVPPTDGG